MQKDCRNNPCQRFGSKLNLNVHVNVLALDSAYSFEHGKARFHRSGGLRPEELDALLRQSLRASRARWWPKMGSLTLTWIWTHPRNNWRAQQYAISSPLVPKLDAPRCDCTIRSVVGRATEQHSRIKAVYRGSFRILTELRGRLRSQ